MLTLNNEEVPDGDVEEDRHEHDELGALFDEESNVEIDVQHE